MKREKDKYMLGLFFWGSSIEDVRYSIFSKGEHYSYNFLYKT